MNITSEQNALIIGTLLGDGFLQKRAQKVRLRICHSYRQKEYVDWKYRVLRSFCERTQPPKKFIRQIGTDYLFATQSEKNFVYYHNLFYQKQQQRYVKIIRPELIQEMQSCLSLAVWWMDDGSARTDCNAGRLATQSYSLEEHQILQQCLMTNFEINSAIVRHTAKNNKVQYSLSIPAKNKQFDKFISLISPYVYQIPSMMHKLGKSRND
uniref:Endonuclease-like protein n=1 Tax=Bryopsis hypnoides TaxID=222885 RepID=D1MEM4_BRYHP|nr:endonuclease-like protein [Bryopsis hypnoides]